MPNRSITMPTLPAKTALWAAGLIAAAALVGCATRDANLRQQGIGFYRAGRYHAAVRSLDASTVNEPTNAKAQYYTGLAYLKLHRYEQAEYHLKVAWDAFPAQKGLKKAMISAMVHQGKTNELLDFLERDAALTAGTQNPNTLPQPTKWRSPSQHDIRVKKLYDSRIGDRLRIAKLYEKIGDLDNAEANYIACEQLAPRDPAVLVQVLKFYQRVGNKAGLDATLRRLYRVDPAMPGLVSMMTKNHVYISAIKRK